LTDYPQVGMLFLRYKFVMVGAENRQKLVRQNGGCTWAASEGAADGAEETAGGAAAAELCWAAPPCEGTTEVSEGRAG